MSSSVSLDFSCIILNILGITQLFLITFAVKLSGITRGRFSVIPPPVMCDIDLSLTAIEIFFMISE